MQYLERQLIPRPNKTSSETRDCGMRTTTTYSAKDRRERTDEIYSLCFAVVVQNERFFQRKSTEVENISVQGSSIDKGKLTW